MSSTLRSTFIAAALAATTIAAQAQEVKIGMVNPERILSEAAPAKAATARLKTEFSGRETQISKEGSALKAAIEKFQKEAPPRPEPPHNPRKKQWPAKEDDPKNNRRQYKKALPNRRNTELEKIQENSKRIIKQIAEGGKYSVILGAESVVYVQPQFDITDQVIKALDAGK